jgi:hypothetical protein
MNMEHFLERELARENEVLGENLPQCRFIHHKVYLESNPACRSGNWASGYFEQGIKHSHIIESGQCFDQLSDCQLYKKISALCILFRHYTYLLITLKQF